MISALFGAGSRLDAYLLAMAGPALLSAILGDLVYSLLLPEFAEPHDQDQAQRWLIATWALSWLAMVTVVYLVSWEVIVHVAATGEEQALLERLGLISSPLILFSGVAALGATVLIADRHYVTATLRIPVASLTAVALLPLLTLVQRSVEMLAISVVAGAMVAALVVVVRVVRSLGRPTMTLAMVTSVQLHRRLGRTSFAQIVAGVVPQAPTPIERLVGFNLGAGVISSLNFGRVLVSPPLLVGQSIATASYPRFVDLRTNDDPRRYEILGRSIGMVVFLLLPLTVILIGLARPLVEVVYHHGLFDAQAAMRTTTAAGILAIALIPIAVGSVVTRFLYAERAAGQVAIASVATFAVYTVMAVVLGVRLGYVGLAIASSGSYVILMGGLLWVTARQTTDGLGFLPAPGLLRTFAAAVPAAVVVWIVGRSAGDQFGTIRALEFIVAGTVASAAAYLLAAAVLRSVELSEAVAFVRRMLVFQRG